MKNKDASPANICSKAFPIRIIRAAPALLLSTILTKPDFLIGKSTQGGYRPLKKPC